MPDGPSPDAPFFFIVNPRAGLGARGFSGISASLRARGVPFRAAATTGPGDALALARLARSGGFHAIVGVGGDGTLSEIVNGFATSDGDIDRNVTLGVIPRGTVQDFARGLGIPLASRAAVERLLAGRTSQVDVGRIRFGDGRVHFFVNVLGAGLDAEIADRAAEVRGAITSIPAHVIGFASALAAYENKEISLSFEGAPGQSVRLRANMVVVANGPSYAGVVRLAPTASLDDGLLDVVVIGDVPKLEFLLNVPRALTGAPIEHEKVTVFRAPSVLLESGDHALVQADGDLVGELPARIDLLPGALRVIR
jgi:YegS/Rv2252/BmrU family lipid kinase